MPSKDRAFPETIGPFEVRQELGRGGMGVVYRGWDPSLERDVAIKVLKTEHVATGERRERFLREARLAAQLSHPNIAVVHSVGESVEGPWMAMEFIDGTTWRDWLRQTGRPELDDVIPQALQIAEALAWAHRHNIVHRDLKPDNIMVDDTGRARVLDFGLARLFEAHADLESMSFETGEGVFVGTPGYMSPEQLLAGRIDHRTDVFSFAATLYEMLSGVQAIRGDSSMSVALATVNAPSIPLLDVAPDVPRALADVVMQGLERAVDARPDGMSAFVACLRPLAGATTPDPGGPGRPPVVPRVNGDAPVALGLLETQVAMTPQPAIPAATSASPAKARGVGVFAVLAMVVIGVSLWALLRADDPSDGDGTTSDSSDSAMLAATFQPVPRWLEPKDMDPAAAVSYAWSGDGTTRAAASDEGVRLVDLATGNERVIPTPQRGEPVQRVSWPSDATGVVAWCGTAADLETLRLDPDTESWSSVPWVRGGAWLDAAGDAALEINAGTVAYVERTSQRRTRLAVRGEPAQFHGFSPDGQRVALTVVDDELGHLLEVWDVRTGERVLQAPAELSRQPGTDLHAAWFLDDAHLLVGGTDTLYGDWATTAFRVIRLADGAVSAPATRAVPGFVTDGVVVRRSDGELGLRARFIRERPLLIVGGLSEAPERRLDGAHRLTPEGPNFTALAWSDDGRVLAGQDRMMATSSEWRLVAIDDAGVVAPMTSWADIDGMPLGVGSDVYLAQRRDSADGERRVALSRFEAREGSGASTMWHAAGELRIEYDDVGDCAPADGQTMVLGPTADGWLTARACEGRIELVAHAADDSRRVAVSVVVAPEIRAAAALAPDGASWAVADRDAVWFGRLGADVPPERRSMALGWPRAIRWTPAADAVLAMGSPDRSDPADRGAARSLAGAPTLLAWSKNDAVYDAMVTADLARLALLTYRAEVTFERAVLPADLRRPATMSWSTR